MMLPVTDQPDEKLKDLARRAIRGEIFTSFQIPEEKRVEYMDRVFICLHFFSTEQWEAIHQNPPGMCWAPMADLLPREIDGLPIFSAIGFLSRNDTLKFTEYCRQIQTAIEGV